MREYKRGQHGHIPFDTCGYIFQFAQDDFYSFIYLFCTMVSKTHCAALLYRLQANYAIYVVSVVQREALDGCWCSAQNKNLCSEPPAGASDKHLI